VRFNTWLYRIGHNLCVDRLRRQRELPIDNVAEPVEHAETADPDAIRLQGIVRREIAALPERQRTALVLCHHQGMTNIEAAQILGVSVDALESLLARARRTLREKLTPYVTGERT
jgi:RNA polymerase sigma-70 factor (ECF subfamily)